MIKSNDRLAYITSNRAIIIIIIILYSQIINVNDISIVWLWVV